MSSQLTYTITGKFYSGSSYRTIRNRSSSVSVDNLSSYSDDNFEAEQYKDYTIEKFFELSTPNLIDLTMTRGQDVITFPVTGIFLFINPETDTSVTFRVKNPSLVKAIQYACNLA